MSGARTKAGVVYTVMFGHYETLKEVTAPKSEAFDYVVFTDDAQLRSDTWRVELVERRFEDPARDAKRVKHLAHTFLPDAEVSIFHDASIDLRAAPEALVAHFLPTPRDGFGGVRHDERTCIYDEARCVADWHIDAREVVEAQMARYRAAGFPEQQGLIAAGVLVRRHHQREVRAAMEAWFHEVSVGSRRDQLSFNYVAWALRFSYRAFTLDLRDNPFFAWRYPEPNRVPYRFDDSAYLALNPDVAACGLAPRAHWSLRGHREGRRHHF